MAEVLFLGWHAVIHYDDETTGLASGCQIGSSQEAHADAKRVRRGLELAGMGAKVVVRRVYAELA